jgi:hypothetical protein
LLLQRDHLEKGEVSVQGVHFTRQRGRHCFRPKTRSDIQPRTARKILAQRDIEKRFGHLANTPVFRIPRDADHLHPAVLYLNALANGILAAPIVRDHGFIHDGDQSTLFIVGTREFPAGNQRNTHRCKIVRPHFVVLNDGLLVCRRLVAIYGNRGR